MAVRKDQIQIQIDIEANQGVKTYQKLLDQTRQVNNEMRQLKKQGKENTAEFKALEKQAAELNKQLGDLGGKGANFAQLQKRAKDLNRELRTLAPGTQRFIDVSNELKSVNTRLAEIRQGTKGVKQDIDEMRIAGIKVPPVFQKMAKGVNTVQLAFKSFIALEIIGFFIRGAQAADELTQRFVKLRGTIQQFTGATGQPLDDFTIRIDAIANTFNKDVDEILVASNALTKQLTGDFGTSLDLIEKGLLSGADANGEFLDSVREYAPFFREAQLSGEQFISVISQGVNEGVFSDKSVDLVKEFNLRIRELPKATNDALNSIGITSKQIRKEIDENGVGGAFLLVQERLNKLGDDAPQVGQVLADVFGGPGEDAGIQFIKNLDLTDEAMSNLIQTGNEYTQKLGEQLTANQELAEAQNEVAKKLQDSSNSLNIYITRVKTFLLNVAASVLSFFEQLPATAKGVQSAFRVVVNNIGAFFSRLAIDLAIRFKQIEKLNPFGKTSKQLQQEIEDLRAEKENLKNEATSVGEAYREAYLAGLKDVEQRKKVSEALIPDIKPDIEQKAKQTARDYVKAVDEELEKIKAERASDSNLLAPLEALSPTSAPGEVESTGEAQIDTSAEDELIKNKFLKGLVDYQAYEDQRFEIAQEAYNRRLEFLREKFGEESAEFIKLENEKLQAQKSYEEQRAELTKRTEEARVKTQGLTLSATSEFVGATIDLLKSEQGERKKSGLALKAFAIGKVFIDAQEAIMSIIKNAEANPLNALFPGASALIAGLKIATVVARSASVVRKITSQGFYGGGHTGNNVLFRDQYGHDVVGAVHKNEYVVSEEGLQNPEVASMVNTIETMRQRGFRDGGFTTVGSIPATAATGPTQQSTSSQAIMTQEMVDQVVQSNREVVEAVRGKQFSVNTGQLRDALDEDYRLDDKTGF